MERDHRLRLHIPEPKRRPGEAADFSDLRLPKPGSVERPAIGTPPLEMSDYADTLICVLDDGDQAVGPLGSSFTGSSLITDSRGAAARARRAQPRKRRAAQP
jgi:2-oxoisovalerate dehydrogenase E1 component alpha subunit